MKRNQFLCFVLCVLGKFSLDIKFNRTMSLADELLADLEEIGNDFDDDDEIKVKEEPFDGDEGDSQDAIEKMEIDESVCE